MTTINQIAKMANVSRTTVSRALNNSGYVSEEARKRIMKAIEETGYVPSEHAKSLRTKRTKVIGVIVPTIRTETSGRIVSGMDEVLSKLGYQILLASTNLDKQKEMEYIHLLKVRQVDGIIFAATNGNEHLQELIQQLEIPIVVVGQEMDGVSMVLYDDYHAARDIVSLFIEKGHRNIGFIGVDESDRSVGYLRKQGYLDEMKHHNLPVEPEWIQKGIFDIESGYGAMERLLTTTRNNPTAVFAVTDRLALGACNYLKEKGYTIPGDIAISSIGGSEFTKHLSPPLTTVDYQNEKAGREAAKIILAKLSGETENKKITLDYRFLIRGSV
ncbi:LacI family DNA-binding transcriptional regulator [Aquibacillus salsiterrae]|uniref:LacI family transcriptional regulator n=1 Tax=Aquibacillus salsiterrae TaxID=2950439 RepID=A0A9X3WCX3_9BACI|nr:LacI family DNA-binding transcriptional regulator [Aquibacillus salsiterrae]MDC3417542.1 LacI family transcriptional regulator [Aquibacillus salsiterrae]